MFSRGVAAGWGVARARTIFRGEDDERGDGVEAEAGLSFGWDRCGEKERWVLCSGTGGAFSPCFGSEVCNKHSDRSSSGSFSIFAVRSRFGDREGAGVDLWLRACFFGVED